MFMMQFMLIKVQARINSAFTFSTFTAAVAIIL